MKDIMFVGNGRCFHTMDWYHNAQSVCAPRKVMFATDLIDSEGNIVLVSEHDNMVNLYNIDWLLFPSQSTLGNIWRNVVKLLVFPIQVQKLKKLVKKNPNLIFHAHSMYYLFLCWAAKIHFIGTPQGSEILVRPDRSSLYRYFASKSLQAAQGITVDSMNMKSKIKNLCSKEAYVIQNGIDISSITKVINPSQGRSEIVSIRGIHPNYRTIEICHGRDNSVEKPSIQFVYPLWEDNYKKQVLDTLKPGDKDIGRLQRGDLYKLLNKTILVVSIPESDSSPRSVYEAIFCGCCVAVTYNSYIDALPDCMRKRLIIVNLEDNLWFDKAYYQAKSIVKTIYEPTEEALDLFDQRKSLEKVAKLFY